VSTETYIAFFLASALLIVVPGPSVLVVVAHAMTFGQRRSLYTILGIAMSHSLFFAVTAVGVAALLGQLEHVFPWVKLGGAAYLVWLGVRKWCTDPEAALAPAAPTPRSAGSLFLQGFAVNTTNPKALVFYAAFFPPFLDPSAPVAGQLLAMGGTFVALLIGISFGYALAAARARRWLGTPRRVRIQNRISGTLLIGAGLGLAAARGK